MQQIQSQNQSAKILWCCTAELTLHFFVFFVVIILERQVHSNPCINLTAVQPSGSQETHLSVFPFLMTSYFGTMLRGSRSAAVLITPSYILYMSRGGRPLQTPNEASYVSAGCQAGRRPE